MQMCSLFRRCHAIYRTLNEPVRLRTNVNVSCGVLAKRWTAADVSTDEKPARGLDIPRGCRGDGSFLFVFQNQLYFDKDIATGRELFRCGIGVEPDDFQS
jgi:hypothetical protein